MARVTKFERGKHGVKARVRFVRGVVSKSKGSVLSDADLAVLDDEAIERLQYDGAVVLVEGETEIAESTPEGAKASATAEPAAKPAEGESDPAKTGKGGK
jgi:hypothetical protein